MTEQQKNIAIAEACGAKWVVVRSIYGFPTRLLCFADKLRRESWDIPCDTDDPDKLDRLYGSLHHSIPNYCQDRNARWQAWMTLTEEEKSSFMVWLDRLALDFVPPMQTLRFAWRLIEAFDTHFCEAFLRTKGLWKDS